MEPVVLTSPVAVSGMTGALDVRAAVPLSVSVPDLVPLLHPANTNAKAATAASPAIALFILFGISLTLGERGGSHSGQDEALPA
jgi:hypothetical protein